MRWLFSLSIVLILFIGLFLFNFFNQPKHTVIKPRKTSRNAIINTTMKEILFYEWNKNLLEIKEYFSVGDLRRGNIKRNLLASYWVHVFLTAIETEAYVSFQQNEDYIENKSNKNISHRIIRIAYNSDTEYEIIINKIKKIIDSFDNKVSQISSPDNNISFNIYNPDEKGVISLDFRRNAVGENTIHIDITRFAVTKVIHIQNNT